VPSFFVGDDDETIELLVVLLGVDERSRAIGPAQSNLHAMPACVSLNKTVFKQFLSSSLTACLSLKHTDKMSKSSSRRMEFFSQLHQGRAKGENIHRNRWSRSGAGAYVKNRISFDEFVPRFAAELQRNQPSVPWFHHFTMIRTCTYPHFSNKSLQGRLSLFRSLIVWLRNRFHVISASSGL